MIRDAFAYPFRNDGWMMILGGSVLWTLLGYLSSPFALGLVLLILSTGYFGAFYLSIINTTAVGENDPPNWPDFSDWDDELLPPFLRLGSIGLISFGPGWALQIATGSEFLGLIGYFYGLAYFPMAAMAGEVRGGLVSVLPHVVLPAIIRTFPAYLTVAAILVVGTLAAWVVQDNLGGVPVLGRLTAGVILLYSLMTEARAVGMIARNKCDELGWNEEAEPSDVRPTE